MLTTTTLQRRDDDNDDEEEDDDNDADDDDDADADDDDADADDAISALSGAEHTLDRWQSLAMTIIMMALLLRDYFHIFLSIRPPIRR